MSDLVGRKLGQYEIIAEVGHGGMANVYRAQQASIGREVAVKVMPATFLQDRTFLERFNREVQIIAKLSHPRILPVYDYGNDAGMPYIVMAYMTGGTLSDWIKKSQGGLSLQEAARVSVQIAEGLDYAHSKGIIHRDFKPSNVLLDESHNVYLADFGIAKMTESTAQLTGSGMVGTPQYMAPEMSQPSGITHLIDVYALGVTLYQMLTGEQPYHADTPMGVLMAHMSHPVPDIRRVRGGLPDGVQPIIERSLAKDPAQRYQSCRELAKAVADVASGKAVPVPAAAATGTVAAPSPIPQATQPQVAKPIAPVAPAAPVAAPPARQGGIPAWLWLGGALLCLCVVGAAVIGLALAGGQGGLGALLGGNETATAHAVESVTAVFHQNETATGEANATATANARATATARAAASATARAEATRAAQERATSIAEPAFDILASAKSSSPVFGPTSGDLLHEADGFLEVYYADGTYTNFVAEVTFANPIAGSGGNFSYGFLFRDGGGNNQYRLAIEEDGTWGLFLNEGEGEGVTVHDYVRLPNFDASNGGQNTIVIIADGSTGYLIANGAYIDELDLSGRIQAGSITLAIEFYQGDEETVGAEVTEFSNFRVWEVP